MIDLNLTDLSLILNPSTLSEGLLKKNLFDMWVFIVIGVGFDNIVITENVERTYYFLLKALFYGKVSLRLFHSWWFDMFCDIRLVLGI